MKLLVLIVHSHHHVDRWLVDTDKLRGDPKEIRVILIPNNSHITKGKKK